MKGLLFRFGEEAWEETGDGYELTAVEALADFCLAPGGTYCLMMIFLLDPAAGASSSSSLSLSPEKRVNCFCVSSTILRAFRSR
jgi:hypothetical protein